MSHTSHSLDLEPTNFVLLATVKNQVGSQRFSTPIDEVDAFENHVLEIPQSKWQNATKFNAKAY